MAEFDCFLKIDGVEGESKDAEHKGELDVESYGWGASQQSSMGRGGGGGAGRAHIRDFHFTAKANKGSLKLMLACATGEHFAKAVLTCRKAGGKQQEFLKITLTEVTVTSYKTALLEGEDPVPTDDVSLSFAQIEEVYREQKADGTLGPPFKVAYDVKAKQKL